MRETPLAFLSYARDADIDDHITSLRRALEREVRLEIGEPFPIFQDRDDISWGENWQKRVKSSIDAATFFIPVITPSFFRSPWCCSEVEQFRARERSLDCDDLILPIKYAEFDDVQVPQAHAHIAALLRTHQMDDWQETRQYDMTHEVVRRKITSMARSIKRSYMKKLPLIRASTDQAAGTVSASSHPNARASAPAGAPTIPGAVIFCHYSMPGDPGRWQDFKRDPQEYVETKWGEQLEAIDACPSVKLAFIFFSHAYAERIKRTPELDLFRSEEVHLILRVKEYIRKRRLNENKYVFMGYEELKDLLNEMDPLAKNSGVSLDDVLTGGKDKLFYDAPKIAEALIRVARREISEPIIRLDEDVAVNEGALLELIATYAAMDRPYCFFSGSYTWHDQNGEKEGNERNIAIEEGREPHWREPHFLNDYSVRLHFLSVGQNGRSFWDISDDVKDKKMSEATKFYLDVGCAEWFLADLKILGYDVYEQPISGAGLCMSHTAVEQLPPFANLTRNITWIDDGIKRALHEGIDDLSHYEDVRVVPAARFRQERLRGQEGITYKDVRWALFDYLPRLFYGLLASNLMYSSGAPGPYALAIKEYMRHREMPRREAFQQWAAELEATVNRMHSLFTGQKYRSASGQALVDICRQTLSLEKQGVRDSISVAVDEKDARSAEKQLREVVDGFESGAGGPQESERAREIEKEVKIDAGVLIGHTIVELRRYFELLEFWPYLTITVVFMMRSKGALFHLLGRNPEAGMRSASRLGSEQRP